jgi:hypothetical protein
MNAYELMFTTDQFNLSRVHSHFINPCCFGEDLAAWLRPKLIERGIQTAEPYQEDWGWELPARIGKDSYYLCMSGNSDGGSDRGEWRIIIEKKRSIAARLAGKGKITADDQMVREVRHILADQSRFLDVRGEDESHTH